MVSQDQILDYFVWKANNRVEIILLSPARREGAISVALVRPSVCLFVRPSPNGEYSRTQRPSVPAQIWKEGSPPKMRLAYQFQGQMPPPLTSTWPHLRCDVGLEEEGYCRSGGEQSHKLPTPGGGSPERC